MSRIVKGCPQCKGEIFKISQRTNDRHYRYTCVKCCLMFPISELCITREIIVNE